VIAHVKLRTESDVDTGLFANWLAQAGDLEAEARA
jgi:hypothetical protein